MVPFSRALVLFALTAATHVASAAEPLRKWTNPQGKSIQARLISIEGETARLQMANGDYVNVALEKFSEEDRKYLESRKTAAESDDSSTSDNVSTKSEDKTVNSPTAATAESELKRNRKWTDRKGKQVNARFVRFHDGKAILMQGNKAVNVPFGDLSDADQAFLKERYEAIGKADDVPPAIPTPAPALGGNPSNGPLPWFAQQQSPSAAAQNIPPNNTAGGPARLPSPPRMELPRPFTLPPNLPPSTAGNDRPQNVADTASATQAIPSATAVASVPAFDPSASQNQQPIYQRQTQDISQPSATSPRPSPRTVGSSFFDSAHTQESPPVPDSSAPSTPFTSAPQMEDVYQCMSCKKIITKKLKAGDKCPHCGTEIDFIVDKDGKTTERSVRSTGKMIKMWVGIAILVLGLIGGAIAKLRGS